MSVTQFQTFLFIFMVFFLLYTTQYVHVKYFIMKASSVVDEFFWMCLDLNLFFFYMVGLFVHTGGPAQLREWRHVPALYRGGRGELHPRGCYNELSVRRRD